MDAPTEAELLRAAQAGDDDALTALLGRYQDVVFRFGLRLCGDRADAEDVLQESLLAMARGVRDFRGGSSLSTWLYTIARSYCIKKRRRRQDAPATVEPLEHAAAVAAPGDDPEAAASRSELSRAIEAAIASLEPNHREVLVLRDVEGLSAAEVAEVLELSVDAVKSRLHRARAAMRAALTAPPPPAGPSCPDVITRFSQQLEGEIGPSLCAELERHLAGCPRCHAVCDDLRAVLGQCRTLPAAPVPADVQHRVRVAVRDYLTSTGR